jgi:hypothetical protein
MLPDVGEVSWHVPCHVVTFMGYDIKEKYERIRVYSGQ